MKNLILNTDSYKTSHYVQYPPSTEFVSSYIESRGGKFDQTLFFGLQAFIKAYLLTPITHADIDEAEAIIQAHGEPFNRTDWETIVDQHEGLLPIAIEALPEGTIINTKNVLVQIVNTDPAFPWLTSYIETALLRAIWYPTTVATYSYQCKKVIAEFLSETATTNDGLNFKLHDFGARGASSEETAGLGGLAHLVNFQGTDTLSAIVAARRFYDEPMAGFSVPAAEHSTITSWGRDGEAAAYKNMLDQFSGPNKLVAVVSDSYDLWHAIDEIWGEELKTQIEQSGGTLVIRPDSGDPVEIVVATIEKLMTKFGYTTNGKGYRVLPNCIRVLQGDGISVDTIEAILNAMQVRQMSAENVAFGMGAELLQKVNRDTQRFAMKASAIYRNNDWHDVFKDPITDPGKRSKKGQLAVIENESGELKTIRKSELNGQKNQLCTVYSNGQLLVTQTLEDIRQRAL